jgi:hypothetical protein
MREPVEHPQQQRTSTDAAGLKLHIRHRYLRGIGFQPMIERQLDADRS